MNDNHPVLSPNAFALLASMALPATSCDIPGDLAVYAAQERDPEAYEELLGHGAIAIGVPPAAPIEPLAGYLDWRFSDLPERRARIDNSAYLDGRFAAITTQGWAILARAIERGAWQPSSHAEALR